MLFFLCLGFLKYGKFDIIIIWYLYVDCKSFFFWVKRGIVMFILVCLFFIFLKIIMSIMNVCIFINEGLGEGDI